MLVKTTVATAPKINEKAETMRKPRRRHGRYNLSGCWATEFALGITRTLPKFLDFEDGQRPHHRRV